jgi:hypothetical protein
MAFAQIETTLIKKLVDENINRPFHEWLEFVQTFKNPGKQGLVGLLKIKKTDHLLVFKVSQYTNYLAQHEAVVMASLNKMQDYCPHFCVGYGILKCLINPHNRKSGNPFELTPDNIEKDVLLMEYINRNATKLYSHIKSSKTSDDVIFASMKQTLMAISVAQSKCQLSHYDLHSLNVMMRKCDKDVVFLYIHDENNQFAVPTRGYYPTIIDFGFSYVQEMDGGPLWPSMAHTDVGFLSDRFDWVADPKLFLVTVSSDVMQNRGSAKKSKLFRKIVKNIFSPLTIDWDAGWDDVNEDGASMYVLELLNGLNVYSKLFLEYDHYCIDIICSLIIMPIEKQNYGDLNVSYIGFLKEFAKIEKDINSNYLKLCILKDIVDAARNIRPFYNDESKRNLAVAYFKEELHNAISKVAKFCYPKDISYEKMLCSLYVLAKSIEGVLYDVMKVRIDKKEEEYKKLKLTSVEHIFGCLECNIPDNYVYSNDTAVFVFDLQNNSSDAFSLKKTKASVLKSLNDTDNLCKGSFLYQLWKKK